MTDKFKGWTMEQYRAWRKAHTGDCKDCGWINSPPMAVPEGFALVKQEPIGFVPVYPTGIIWKFVSRRPIRAVGLDRNVRRHNGYRSERHESF